MVFSYLGLQKYERLGGRFEKGQVVINFGKPLETRISGDKVTEKISPYKAYKLYPGAAAEFLHIVKSMSQGRSGVV